ncbi:MAG: hypothetical protein Q7S88_03570 [Candidatus Daviesbacteria bacterium]|nr:hypothetical protein [Candidatus Daviesbacteria bacterium]
MNNKASSTLLKDAFELIISYHDNPSFRARVDILINQPRAVYRGSDGVWRPLKAYLFVAAQASEDPSLKGIYKKCHGKAEQVEEQTKEFLKTFYKKERARSSLQQKVRLEAADALDQETKESVEEIKKIDQETKGLPDVKRHDQYQESLAKVSQVHPSVPEVETISSEPKPDVKITEPPPLPVPENPQFEAALAQVEHPSQPSSDSPATSTVDIPKSETTETDLPKASAGAVGVKKEPSEVPKPELPVNQSSSPVKIEETSLPPIPAEPDNKTPESSPTTMPDTPPTNTPEAKTLQALPETSQPLPAVFKIIKLAEKIHLPLFVKVLIRKISLKVFTPTTIGVLTAGAIGAFVGAPGGPRAALVGFGVGTMLPLAIKKLDLGSTVFGGGGASSYSGSGSSYDDPGYDSDYDQEPQSNHQGSPRGGGGNMVNSAVSIGKNARNMARLARLARAGKLAAGVTPVGAALLAWEHKKKIAYLVAGIIIIFFFFFRSMLGNFSTLLVGTGQEASLFPEPPITPGEGGAIASCTFYRGGDSVSGLKFGNPNMTALISQISGEIGVPAVIVAGIMRVETASAVASTDNSYLTNDYDAHSSGVAYGVMQFTIGTFNGVFQTNRAELQAKYNKTEATTTINPQSAMAPVNVFRIYSIKDSIIAAALKVREDKISINGNGPWDKETVTKIAKRYYGGLEYIDFRDIIQNYGEDLWKSYNSCTGDSSAPPIQDNNYQAWIRDNFDTSFQGEFQDTWMRWTYEVLYKSSQVAPKFKDLIKSRGSLVVIASPGVSNRSGNIINFNTSPGGPTATEALFKVTLIHELAHNIKGQRGENEQLILPAITSDNGFITGYAQGSTAGNNLVCTGVDSGEVTVQRDEDFAESVTFYINDNFSEQDMDRNHRCPPRTALNPYQVRSESTFKFPNHCSVMKQLLGGNNCQK